MKSMEIFKKLAEISSKKLIETSNHTGDSSVGGFYITKDKKIYKYKTYFFSEESLNDCIEMKELNDEEYAKVIKFIEEEKMNKENLIKLVEEIWENSKFETQKQEFQNSNLDELTNKPSDESSVRIEENSKEAILSARAKEISKEAILDARVEELSKKAILKVSRSWMLSDTPGTGGIIVTNDKKIYKYVLYSSYTEVPVNSYIEEKLLNDVEYEEITTFIQSEILDKDIQSPLFKICDASFYVIVNYKGKRKDIKDEMEIYDKASGFLEKIWENLAEEI